MGTEPPPLPGFFFLLNPKNDALLNGLAVKPADENPPSTAAWKISVAMFTLLFFGYWLRKDLLLFLQDDPPPLLFPSLLAVFLISGMVLAAYTTIEPILRNRRFQRPCQVLEGELLSCKEVVDDEVVDWRLTYHFRSPSGKLLSGKWTTEGTVNRVEGRIMPRPGARIAIAYINDRTHRIL